MPALTIEFINQKINPRLFITFILSYFSFVFLFNDKFTTLGMLKGINNMFDINTIPLFQILDRFNLGTLTQGLAHAAFSATVFFIIKDFFYPSPAKQLNISFKKILLLWLIVPIATFFFSHFLIAQTGYSFDTIQDSQQSQLVLHANDTITQTITPQYNNLAKIELQLKNINLRFQQSLHFQIIDSSHKTLYQTNIPGNQIGDDFNLNLEFPPIPNSANQTYQIILSAPQTISNQELIIPYDIHTPGMQLNSKEFQGKLSYILYQRESNPISLFSQSLRILTSKW